MSPRGLLVVGSGKRVRETALPALLRCPEGYALKRVVAKSAKRIEVEGRAFEVGRLAELDARDMEGVDLVYAAVGKDAAPAVLARLAELARAKPGGLALLVDTPVLRVKHWRHARHLRAFRQVDVAEDVLFLPWLEPVRAALAAGAIGALERVELLHSGYAYHAVALARCLLGARRVRRAKRERLGEGRAQRWLRFERGEALVVEPRDYAVGGLVLVGATGSIADRPLQAPNALAIECLLREGELVGFRVGAHEHALDAPERELARGHTPQREPARANAPARELARGDAPGAGVIGRMEALKRVGFLRLARSLAAGRGAHALDDALEDTLVDYALERLGRWRATPFTSVRGGLLRALASLG